MASLRYACGWVPLTGKQSTMKDSLVDRITYELWRCTEGVRKQGVIQAFHRIQSVKLTNRVMLCYTRAKSSQCVNVGVAEHRQATHEHVSTCRHACVRVNGNLRSEHWRRQAPWRFIACAQRMNHPLGRQKSHHGQQCVPELQGTQKKHSMRVDASATNPPPRTHSHAHVCAYRRESNVGCGAAVRVC